MDGAVLKESTEQSESSYLYSDGLKGVRGSYEVTNIRKPSQEEYYDYTGEDENQVMRETLLAMIRALSLGYLSPEGAQKDYYQCPEVGPDRIFSTQK